MKKIFAIILSFISLSVLGQTTYTIQGGDPRTLFSPGKGLTYNNGLYSTDSTVPLNISISGLRASTTLQYTRLYYFSDTGRQGTFRFFPGGHADDNGIFFVDGLGNTWQRQFTGAVVPDGTGLSVMELQTIRPLRRRW